jgi:hypothetical protein
MIDEMDSILQLERKRFENKSDINEISFFWFIKKFSSEVEDYMITIMGSLSTSLPEQRKFYRLSNQNFIQSLSHPNESTCCKKTLSFSPK